MLNFKKTKRKCTKFLDWLNGLACGDAMKQFILGWDKRSAKEYLVCPKGVEHPVILRARTSDINVFNQVFLQREYERLRFLDEHNEHCGIVVPTLVCPCYFLNKHPNARLVAIEPDRENYELLKRNLEKYSNRVTILHAGVWSHETNLVLSEVKYRD